MDKLLNKSLLLKSIYSKQIKITNPNYISVKIVLRQCPQCRSDGIIHCNCKPLRERNNQHISCTLHFECRIPFFPLLLAFFGGRGWALINFFHFLGGRLFKRGANSRLGAKSNKYGIWICIKPHYQKNWYLFSITQMRISKLWRFRGSSLFFAVKA